MFWGLSVLVLIGKPCSLSACVVLHYVAVRLFIRAFGDAHLDFFVVVIKNSTAKQYPWADTEMDLYKYIHRVTYW